MAGLWSGSTYHYILPQASPAAGPVTNSANDPFCAGYSGSGRSTYTLPGQPVSNAPPLSVFGLNAYTNPAAAEAFLNLPPTNYALGKLASLTNGQLYLANEADLYLTNFPQGTNWGNQSPLGSPMALYYQNQAIPTNFLTWITNDFYVVSNVFGSVHVTFVTNRIPPTSAHYFSSIFQATNGFRFTNGMTGIFYTNSTAPQQGTNYVLYMGYSFLTNVLFYDWREGWHTGSGPAKKVYAVQLDLQTYNRWMTNPAPNGGLVITINAWHLKFIH